MGFVSRGVFAFFLFSIPTLAQAQDTTWSKTWFPDGHWEVIPGNAPTLDADVCAPGVLVVKFTTGRADEGADRARAFFAGEFGLHVEAERLYPDELIHPDNRMLDPHGLSRFVKVSGIAIDGDVALAELRWELAGDSLIASDDDVALDCTVLALSRDLPDEVAYGWNQSFLRIDRGDVAHFSPRIAVLDTGIDDTHPIFDRGPDMGAGYNYVDGNPDLADGNGHGTHVAGIVATVAPGAEIIPIKVLDDHGSGHWSSVGRGLLHAAAVDADVVNMSLGSSRMAPEFVQAAIDEVASTYDTVMVAAAGHSCSPGDSCMDVFAPAIHASVLSVGALDSFGLSEDRAAGGLLDLLAPGVHVCSAWPTADTDPGASPYRRWSGSSMAAAHASAVAGLVRNVHPDMDQMEVRGHLFDTAGWASTAFTCPGEAGLLDACGALGLYECTDRWAFLDHPPGLTCGTPDPEPALERLELFPTYSGTAFSCPGITEVSDSFASGDPGSANTPPSYCPDQTSALSVRCSASVAGLPLKSPCTDCDLEIVDPEVLRLRLRLQAADLSKYGSYMVRLHTVSGQTYVYSLGVAAPTGTKAQLRYQIDVGAQGGPDLVNEVLSAMLVSQYSGNGRHAWVADPLRIVAAP